MRVDVWQLLKVNDIDAFAGNCNPGFFPQYFTKAMFDGHFQAAVANDGVICSIGFMFKFLISTVESFDPNGKPTTCADRQNRCELQFPFL